MNNSDTEWSALPSHLNLPFNEIHVWQAELDLPEHSVYAFRRMLSPDELERAHRFHFEKHRRRFIVARGLLRHVLSRYLTISPTELEFCYGAWGKPELSTFPSLHFNLSHSEGIVLYAFGHNCNLGVDVERIRSNVEYLELAKRFFSPAEYSMLLQVDAHLVSKAFFNCWTRKEAYIKAIGKGLSFPLDCFDVSLMPGEPATLLDVRDSQQEQIQWSMHELFVGPEFSAALVVEGHDRCLRYSQLH